jgi:hypothetical protein
MTETSAGTITIIVSPEGKAVVETSGYNGSTCRDASLFIEQALGQRVGETLKSEFFADNSINNNLNIGINNINSTG